MSKAPQKQEKPFALELSFDEALQRFANVNTKDLAALSEDETAPEEVSGKVAAPFLKWVGGKRSIIGELKSRMPAEYGEYWEPFIGGGALFFDLHSTLRGAHISDLNWDLIITYKVVQQEVEKLITALQKHAKLHCDEYYYRVRSKHDLQDPIEIAARLIYLNKTCFNGLYRVNKKGEFNVPVGKYANPAICAADNLRACNKALQGVSIEYRDYHVIDAKAGDFVYFDPPYHPTSDTASFTAYSKFDFTEKDQAALAEFCTGLHKKGVKVMISNSNTAFIRDLYKANIFKIAIVSAPRMVNCKANSRNAVEEVLITNY